MSHPLFSSIPTADTSGCKASLFQRWHFVTLLYGKKSEKIDKLCSFSVREKQAAPYFILSKLHSFQQPSYISDKQWIGQAFNSSFWGTEERNCPSNSPKMSQNRFLVFWELWSCTKTQFLPWTVVSKCSTPRKPLSQGKGWSPEFRVKAKHYMDD